MADNVILKISFTSNGSVVMEQLSKDFKALGVSAQETSNSVSNSTNQIDENLKETAAQTQRVIERAKVLASKRFTSPEQIRELRALSIELAKLNFPGKMALESRVDDKLKSDQLQSLKEAQKRIANVGKLERLEEKKAVEELAAAERKRVQELFRQENLAKQAIERETQAMNKLRDSFDRSRVSLNSFNGVARTGFILLGGWQVYYYISQAITKATSELFKFNLVLRQTQGIAQVNDEELKKFAKTALDMSKSTEYLASAAARAGLDLNKMGLSLEETRKQLTPSLDLASVAEVVPAEAAQAINMTLKAYRLSGEEAVRVADLIYTTTSKSAMSFYDYAESMKTIAPIAYALGTPLEEAMALIAGLSNVEIRGTMAGTSLKNIMLNLLQPSAEVAAALRKMGLEGKSLSTILNTLRNTYGMGVLDFLKTFNLRAIPGALAISEMSDSINDLTVELGQGQLKVADGAALIRKAFSIEFEQVLASIGNVGNALENVVRDAQNVDKGFKTPFKIISEGFNKIADSMQDNPLVKEKVLETLSLTNEMLKFTAQHSETFIRILGDLANVIGFVSKSLIELNKHLPFIIELGKAFLIFKGSEIVFRGLGKGLAGLILSLPGIRDVTTGVSNLSTGIVNCEKAASKASIFFGTIFADKLTMIGNAAAIGAAGFYTAMTIYEREVAKYEKLYEGHNKKNADLSKEGIEAKKKDLEEYKRLLEAENNARQKDASLSKIYIERSKVTYTRPEEFDLEGSGKAIRAAIQAKENFLREQEKTGRGKGFFKLYDPSNIDSEINNLKKSLLRIEQAGAWGRDMERKTKEAEQAMAASKDKEYRDRILKNLRESQEAMQTSSEKSDEENLISHSNYFNKDLNLLYEHMKNRSMAYDDMLYDFQVFTNKLDFDPKKYGEKFSDIKAFKPPKGLKDSESLRYNFIIDYDAMAKQRVLEYSQDLDVIGKRIKEIIKYNSEFEKNLGSMYNAPSLPEKLAADYKKLAEAMKKSEKKGSNETVQAINNEIQTLASNTSALMDQIIAIYDYRLEKLQRSNAKELEELSKLFEKRREMYSFDKRLQGMAEAEFENKQNEIKRASAEKERQLFEKKKKWLIAQSIINTAAAVSNALASGVPPFNFINAALVAAAGAIQTALISKQEFAKRMGGLVTGQGNSSSDSVRARLSVGEYVVDAETVKRSGGEKGVERKLGLANVSTRNENINIYVDTLYGDRRYIKILADSLNKENLRRR